VGCGKPGVTICASCSKQRRYRQKLAARINLLEAREPELYKRLDELSRLPLDGNERAWDDFCIQIKSE
jgi:hypothetical protein